MNPIEIAWNNGSKISQITLALGEPTLIDVGSFDINGYVCICKGMTQLEDYPHASICLTSDGFLPGQLYSIDIQDNGQIISHYTNGLDKVHYIPLAKVNCSSCLVEYGDDTYQYTGKLAEDLIIKNSLSGSLGMIIPRELEY